MQLSFTGCFLLTEPTFELFRSVRGAIIQDQDHGVDLPPKGFGNDLLLHEGLEIDKAFALTADAIDLAIRDGEPGKQMACAATMVARFVQTRLAWTGGTRGLFALTGLNGGLLIQTDQPGACL